ncbi:serine protease inhibitor Kazal-type 5-like [Molothrus ater]|uniref:serine protease inhibitor Kazal-type 5-like n=1 Tax=Molothrus ater TaxID=84834 RepID=UPI0017481C5A|nr:serine protease inhibitor Kazal-type 5-like [Molothrus ater]
MVLAMGFELSRCLFCLRSHEQGIGCSLCHVWCVARDGQEECGLCEQTGAAESLQHTQKRFSVNKQFSGSCWEPPLIALLCAFQNECRNIWPLLRSGKYSCPITRETFSSPNKKGDLNKCMMCQRLLERDSKTQGSGGEMNRNVNSLGKDECREFRDLFKRGKLSCTRENDPVRDASGKQHSNKCIMCAEKFKRENEQKLSKNRQGKDKDDCSEFRSQFEAGGRLSCTRENAPVRDASGRQHTNKCLMCAEKFKKEAQRGGGTLQRNKLPPSERIKQKNCGGSRQGVNERRPFSSGRGPQAQRGRNCNRPPGRKSQSRDSHEDPMVVPRAAW